MKRKMSFYLRTNLLMSSALAAVLLSGCATTPQDLMQRTPLYFESDKSSQTLAACIGDGWEMTLPFVRSRPTKNGYQVALADSATGHTYMLAEIVDLQRERSSTKFWMGSDLWIDSQNKAIRKTVEDCQ